MQEKRKMAWQKDKNLAHIQQQYSVSFCKKSILIFLADMAFLMSDFDDFDNDHIS